MWLWNILENATSILPMFPEIEQILLRTVLYDYYQSKEGVVWVK
jgi:hypothetical protein